MKSSFVGILLLIICPHILIAQWHWQNPIPQGSNVKKAIMISEDVIVAACGNGSIIRSENRGWDWNIFYLDVKEPLWELGFFNEKDGITIPLKGCVYLTSDAGKSWVEGANCDSCQYGYAPRLEMVDVAACYLFRCGMLKYSDDKGKTWSDRTFPGAGPTDMCFINRFHGWMLCSTYDPGINYTYNLYETTDGGYSWNEIYETNGFWGSSIYFANDKIGYFVLNFVSYDVLKTIDGGHTWDRLYAPGVEVRYMVGLDENNVWIKEDYYSHQDTYRTSDGGETWIEVVSPGKDYNLLDAHRSVTWEGYNVYSTSDGGMNWEKHTSDLDIQSNINDIFFINDSTGWAYGDGFILKTFNRGLEWNKIYSGSKNIAKVHFFDKEHGLMSIIDGTMFIYKSNDGGISWDEISLPWAHEPSGITDFWAFSPDTFWIGGRYHHLHFTKDGGENWEDYSMWVSGYINKMHFIDDSNAWIASGAGVFKTTDAWNTFSQEFPEANYPWNIVTFSKDGYGLVWNAEDYGFSSDWGNTWQMMQPNLVPLDATFIGDQAAYRLSVTDQDVGGLEKSIDGGETWERQKTHLVHEHGGLFFLENNNGWIVDGKGRILHNKEIHHYNEMNIQPQSLQLPSITPGESKSGTISLINYGTKPIRIDSIFCHDPFTIWNEEDSTWISPLKGFHIQHSPPNNQVEVIIRFTTELLGQYTDTLVIKSSLGNHHVVLSGDCLDNYGFDEPIIYHRIYPNPSFGQIWIDHNDISKLQIFDMQGRSVQFSSSKYSESIKIEIPHPAKGIYVLSWISGDMKYSSKILITP